MAVHPVQDGESPRYDVNITDGGGQSQMTVNLEDLRFVYRGMTIAYQPEDAARSCDMEALSMQVDVGASEARTWVLRVVRDEEGDTDPNAELRYVLESELIAAMLAQEDDASISGFLKGAAVSITFPNDPLTTKNGVFMGEVDEQGLLKIRGADGAIRWLPRGSLKDVSPPQSANVLHRFAPLAS